MTMVQITDLQLERACELALEPGVLSETPGLDVMAAAAQKHAQTDQRRIGRSKTGDQQNRVAIASWPGDGISVRLFP